MNRRPAIPWPLFLLAIPLLCIGLPRGGASSDEKPIDVKVLVLNFDPPIPQEQNRRLHVAGGWNDPRQLADGYVSDVREASHGLVRFRIVEWKDVDRFHTKIDGFTYTPEEYMACRKSGKGWHKTDNAEYTKT